MPFYSLHPFPYLFLLLLIPLTTIGAFTLPIIPLNITSLTQNLTTSLTDPTTTYRGHCVDDSRFSNWSGAITSTDCLIAQHKLELRVQSRVNKQYTYWSRKYTRTPPLDGWELPLMAGYSAFPTHPPHIIRSSILKRSIQEHAFSSSKSQKISETV